MHFTNIASAIQIKLIAPEPTSDGLDLLFRNGRTHNAWQDRPVDTALLKQAWDLTVLAPTSANCEPMRITFVTTDKARARLRVQTHSNGRSGT
ncbi:hypothetical protein [Thalassospira sp.]|uniref:hypothetical protein n=1 Tax=Thalassospira sp. TaxID=1912094 RepID=UPI003AA95220